RSRIGHTRLFLASVGVVLASIFANNLVAGELQPTGPTDVPVLVTNGAVRFAMESIDQVLAREAVNPTVRGAELTEEPCEYPGFEEEKEKANEAAAAGAAPMIPPRWSGPPRERPLINFQNPGTCGCEPPDPILTVGPTHVLAGINDNIRAFTKSNG